MMRHKDWEALLAEWAHEVRGQPFEWGRTDCASLMREGLRRISGVDPVPEMSWGSLKTGQRILKSKGLEERIAEAGGVLVEEGPAFAQGGDILFVPEGLEFGLPAMCLNVGGLWLGSTQDDGVYLTPLLEPLPAAARLYRFVMSESNG